MKFVPRGQGRDLRGVDNTDDKAAQHPLPSRPSISLLPAGEPVITVPAAAEKMGVIVTKVQNLLKQHEIIAVDNEGVAYLPEKYFTDEGNINKFVPGVTKLLADGSYSDEEIIEFLFTEDDSLPGRPIDALHGHLAREVMRRAQSMAL